MSQRKNILFIFLLLIGITSCKHHTGEALKSTIIKLSHTEIDLGKLKVNTLCEKELSITNMGEVPLKIYRVATSCGCTEVEWSQKPIRPQKSSVIKIKYKDKYPGFIHKTITIYGNIEKPLEVKLKGELTE